MKESPPVLFLVFNRPTTTARVFARLRDARPSRLFIAADGPRPHRPGEVELCAQVRRLIDEGIDWDCKVERLYRTKNVGCKLAVSGAITWFFRHVEAGIILEDDCLPDPTFFPFCGELLERYHDDRRVMHIAGFNPNPSDQSDSAAPSYLCWHFGSIWGWATWRRAWANYDVEMKAWPEFLRSGSMRNYCTSEAEMQSRIPAFSATYDGRINTWDYQWAFTRLRHGGVSLTPCTNLISNLGFDSDATHTVNSSDRRANAATQPLSFPLQHPATIVPCTRFGAIYWQGIQEPCIPRPSFGRRLWLAATNPRKALQSILRRLNVIGCLLHGLVVTWQSVSA